MADEYLSLEEAARELQVTPEELKRMVSEEEIRAFRDGGELKFKVEDVIRVKDARENQPTIVLPVDNVMGEGGGEGESPTVVDLDTTEAVERPTEATEAAGPEIIPTIEMDAVSADSIGLKEEEEEEILAPLQTEGIGIADEEPATVTETVEDVSQTAISDQTLGLATDEEEERRVASAAPAEEEEPAVIEVETPVHVAYVVLLVLGFLVLVYSGMIIVDIVRQPAEIPPYLQSVCQWILGTQGG